MLGGYSFIGGLISLLGWATGAERLIDWGGNGVTIKANAAVGIIVSAVALLMQTRHEQPARFLVAVRGLSTFVAVLGGLTLLEHLSGWNLGIDTLLFDEAYGARATFSPGRFGLVASVSFMIVGTALVLLTGGKRARSVASVLGFGTAAIALVSLMGFLFDVNALHAGPRITAISVQASSMFFALGLGIIAAVRETGIGAIVTARGPGGMMARRMLWTTLWVPPTLCWAGRMFVIGEVTDASMALALVAVTLMVFLTVIVLTTASMIERSATALRDQEEQFRRFFELGLTGAVQADAITFRFILVNDQFCEITGYSRGELLSFSVPELTHPDDRAADSLFLAKLISGETGEYDREVRYLRKDGRVVWAHVVARVVRGPDGTPLHTVALIKDISVRIAAAKQLAEYEDRMRLATAATGVGLWEWNIKTGQIRWDAPMFKIYGIAPTPDGLVRYSDWSEAVHPDDLPRQEEILQELIRKIGTSIRGFRIRRSGDGSQRVIHSVETVRTNERGEAEWVVGTNLDITARRESEDAIRRQSETFYHIVANNPFGVYVVDEKFELRGISLGARKVFENVPDAFGRNFAEVIRIIWPEPFASDVIAKFRHTLASGEPYTAPSVIQRRQDTKLVEAYDWRIERIGLPDGRLGVVCYFYDLSERRRWEIALQDSERRFRAIFNSTFEYIGLTTPEGNIIQANRAALDSIGATDADIEGVALWDAPWWARYPADRERVHAGVQRAADGEFVRFEAKYSLKDGSEAVVDLCISPVRDESGKVVLLVPEGHDITQRKAFEVELAAHRENLQQLVEQKTIELSRSTAQLQNSERLAALGNLAAGLGHDLANLTLPIRMRIDAIRAGEISDEVQEDLTAISKALDHLGNMSAGMRLMAMDTSREQASRPVENMEQWCSQATPVLRAVLPRHLELRCEMHTNLAPNIPSHRLMQAVFNIVQNAGEAMAAQTKGFVRMWDEEAPARNGNLMIRLLISDNGPGMSDEVMARCFEPYFSTKGRAISTGMGLGMVRGVVESAGGNVAVSSSLGEGTTFSLLIPALKVALVQRNEHLGDVVPRYKSAFIALVSIAEPKVASMCSTFLQGLGVEIVGLESDKIHADALSRSTFSQAHLWIAQDPSRALIQSFLSQSPHCRIVALYSSIDHVAPEREIDDAGPGTSERVTSIPLTAIPSSLRATLTVAVQAIKAPRDHG